MFEIGDDVVCINADCQDNLTEDKIYYVVHHSNIGNILRVINDENTPGGYFANRFVKLSEYRRKKLEKICLKLEK